MLTFEHHALHQQWKASARDTLAFKLVELEAYPADSVRMTAQCASSDAVAREFRRTESEDVIRRGLDEMEAATGTERAGRDAAGWRRELPSNRQILQSANGDNMYMFIFIYTFVFIYIKIYIYIYIYIYIHI